MVKDIFLTLSSIKYSGKSIGDDIRIEIETLGEFVVIERDLVLNDTGSEEVEMKINVSSSKSQTKTYRIKVVESRWKFVQPSAFFDITLRANTVESTRYIEEQNDGWLRVKIDDKTQSLPAFLMVRYDRKDPKREYFTILEGIHRGKTASVKVKKGNESYLLPGDPHTGSIRATYSISKKRLTVSGESYSARGYLGFPWQKKQYDIEIPDAPHSGGSTYSTKAKKAKVWFRVSHNGDRYIHTGRFSLGCITLTEHEKWDDLYSIFIKSRKGDSMSIGTLDIAD